MSSPLPPRAAGGPTRPAAGRAGITWNDSARWELGRVLAAGRRAAGYTQAQLADAIGYSRSTVSNAEIGHPDVARAFWSRCDQILGTGQEFAAAFDQVTAVEHGHPESGAPLVLSSDHPCGPLDPLRNLRAAAGRAIAPGRILQPGQALTRGEAVRAATVGAARSLRAAGSGGLFAGEVADLAICSGEPVRRLDRERAWRHNPAK